MTPERWHQIFELFEQARSLPPDERSSLLDGACLSDPDLRKEVEALLAEDENVRSSFLAAPPLRVALRAGTKLGEYEIKSMIGAGGMGEVYRARDTRLGRDVAIKVLPALLSVDPERLRRFEQEARAAAALNHPNILAVFQMGTHEGSPYLVSELLEGETLREQLRRGGIAVRKAIDYGVQIARGLSAAHEKGIVHRDLKPENLFVTKDGRVKILDFGLAKLTQPQTGSEQNAETLDAETEPGAVMGTLGYMSPEQVRGQPANHRTDIFSFGAILYEMLAGKRAFQRPTAADTQSAILNEDPPSISQIATSTPPALQRVVHRCLEKSPEQRFQSASDLAFALDALSQGPGSTPALESGKPEKRRRVRVWVVAAGTLIVVLAALGFWRWRAGSNSTQKHGDIIHKQLTASAPEDPVTFAALSRDGKYLAYTTALSKKTHILEIDSGEARDLPAPDAPHPIDWFPDGSHLLVERPGHPELWKVSIWDGGYRKLFDQEILSYGRVSPDGARIAFFEAGKGQLWLSGADGQDPHRILALQDGDLLALVTWSPHGQRMVYEYLTADAVKPEVIIESCDLQGGNRNLIYSDHGAWRGSPPPLDWLPDGRIVFASTENPSQTYNLRAMAADMDTGKPLRQPVTLTASEGFPPNWVYSSGDGKRLIYDSRRDRQVLFLADLRSRGKPLGIRRLINEDWPSVPTDWTRDSRAVYYDSMQHGKWVVMKQGLSAQAPESIVSGSAIDAHAVLSPSGDRLLFKAAATNDHTDPTRRVITMPADGGTQSVLLNGYYEYRCAYLASGGCVLGQPQGHEIVFSVLDPVKGRGAEIARVNVEASNQFDWALSPDGTRIAIADTLKWIRILTIADHKIVDLPRSGTWWDAQYVSWAADGKHLFAPAWSDNSGRSQAILYLDLNGNAEVVTEVDSGSALLADLKASPDGRYLAFTKIIYEGNITMLENF